MRLYTPTAKTVSGFSVRLHSDQLFSMVPEATRDHQHSHLAFNIVRMEGAN